MPIGIKGIQKGQKFSDEHKRKLSIATSHSRLGTHHSLETRKKLSELKRGENNPNWNGGSSPLNKNIRMSAIFRMWREVIFKRDNWTCRGCGERGGTLHPHHIFEFAKFPDMRFSLNNGVTLCYMCHSRMHKKQLDN